MATHSSPSQDLIPIRVSTLRSDVELPFNVFVTFKNQYLHYRKPTQIFEADRIEKLLTKKIKKVFIRPEEEPAYLSYLEAALDHLQKADVSIKEKADFAQQAMMNEAENIEKNLDTEEGYNRTQARISKVIGFVTTEPGSLKELLLSAGISVDTSAHSSTVATMALAIAGKIGFKDEKDLMSMSLASLLHDVGLAKLGFDPMVAEQDIPKSDLAKWRQHPAEAVNMLAGKKYITPRVLKLIIDHHEMGEGQGFPEKKRLKKLPISSQLFNLCDRFDHFCITRKSSPMEGLDPFIEASSELFDLTHFEALEKLIRA